MSGDLGRRCRRSSSRCGRRRRRRRRGGALSGCAGARSTHPNLGCISAISRRSLGCLSAVSRPSLGCLSVLSKSIRRPSEPCSCSSAAVAPRAFVRCCEDTTPRPPPSDVALTWVVVCRGVGAPVSRGGCRVSAQARGGGGGEEEAEGGGGRRGAAKGGGGAPERALPRPAQGAEEQRLGFLQVASSRASRVRVPRATGREFL